MSLLSNLSKLCRNIFRRQHADQDLDEEVRSYVDLLAEEKIKQGMTQAEARRAARLEAGGVEQVKDAVRDVRVGGWLDTLVQDLRYGLRMLANSPGFTIVAVITLALGIGANTAIFSVVNAVLLQPLPFTESDRLVQLWETETAVPKAPLAGPDYFDWRSQNQTLQSTTLYGWPTSLNLSSTGEADHVFGIPTDANFFSVLGARPLIGRAFLEGEDQTGRNHVVILSYGLWQRRFGGRPEVLDQAIELSGETYQVVGVMPANFEFPFQADLWLPMEMNLDKMDPRGEHSYRAIGRLKPGITPQQAESNLQAIAKNLERQYPQTNDQIGATAVPLREQLVGQIRPALLVLFGAVLLVLLIACVNVVNLLLARASARRREIAIRNALGATRARLVRQLLTESVLLSIVAGVPGLLLGAWGVDLLRLLPGVPISNPDRVRVDLAVLFFATGDCRSGRNPFRTGPRGPGVAHGTAARSKIGREIIWQERSATPGPP